MLYLDQSSCDHAMAPTYFTESISSKTGFWGGFCPSKYDFVSGKCPVENGERQLMGEHACKRYIMRYLFFNIAVVLIVIFSAQC